MTIKEIRDVFYARYSLQCQLRKMEKIELGDKIISHFISAAQQDIQRRLSVVESTTDITLGTTSNLYPLPITFGKVKHAYIGGDQLLEKPIVWVEKQGLSSSDGSWFAIKMSGRTPYIYCPVTSGTLTVIYYPDLGYYQPSVGTSQTWGTFNGVVYSGYLILPDRYDMAIEYWMLAQIFPEYYALYEKELKSLRESRQFSVEDALTYNVAGLDDDVIEMGYSLAASTTTTITTSITSLDSAVKSIRIRVDDTGASTISFSSGWDSTPTIVNGTTSIAITSSAGEFENWVQVSINNDLFGWVQTGATTITVTPSPTTGWGEAEIIINIYA